MRVVIGPVDARSARAWLAYAHRVLDQIDELAPGECFTAPDTVGLLREFVDGWSRVSLGDEFCWDEDVAPERLEFAMHAFQRLVAVLARRAEVHGRTSPPEGDAFYVAVLQGAILALESEGPASAAFAEHLADSWAGGVTIS